MDEDFLLYNDTAKVLYHDCAKKLPIIDYHCHINPQEIAENRRFTNLTQLWLEADHYKWRLMRANGEDEKFVTGDGSDYEKFLAFARMMPKAIGNPVYHWAHLELKRYFDCDLILSPKTAAEIWDICNQKLKNDDMSAQGFINKSKVEIIVTTDDPLDSLEWHQKITSTFSTKVLPAFRPDKVVNIDKPEFADYVKKLGESSNKTISTIEDLYTVLEKRLDYFKENGAITADHGLDYIPFAENAEREAPLIFKKALSGTPLSVNEVQQYKTALLLFFGREYHKRSFVMQMHFGVLRNINHKHLKLSGPDSGYDAISTYECSRNIAAFLNRLDESNELPKTILYSLNPGDDAMLQTIAASFPGRGIISKVQQGSAWWFNDTKQGIKAQLTNLASRGLLGGFIGMLTDSRSFLSYVRHEYFRRILCNLVGDWAEKGEYPHDMDVLYKLIGDISYNNVKTYFGL